MIREGADAWNLGRIYMAVAQAFMLYRSETWVTTSCSRRILGGFHHRVARRLTGRQPWIVWGCGWVYPLLEDAMSEAVLK